MLSLYEHAREELAHDLQREMARSRRLAYLPQYRLSRSWRVAGKFIQFTHTSSSSKFDASRRSSFTLGVSNG